jgi:hypothetical protein
MDVYGPWIDLATGLGMSLRQCMREHTERERDAVLWRWRQKERDAWNEPSRADWYAMQVAAEVGQLRETVRCLFGGQPRQVETKEFKLTFDFEEAATKSPETEAEIRRKQVELGKTVWTGVLSSHDRS